MGPGRSYLPVAGQALSTDIVKEGVYGEKGQVKNFWYYFDKLVNGFAFVSGVGLGVIAFIIVADVVMRYAFNKPFSFTTPLAELILVLILTFGGTYLLREQDFIRVDIIVQFLPRKAQIILRCIVDLIGSAVFLIVGLGVAVKLRELYLTKAIIINSGGNWRHWVYMAPLVVFFFVIPVQFLRNSMDAVKMLRSGSYLSDGNQEAEITDSDHGLGS